MGDNLKNFESTLVIDCTKKNIWKGVLGRSRFRGRRGSKDWVGFVTHNLKRAADMAKISNQKAS